MLDSAPLAQTERVESLAMCDRSSDPTEHDAARERPCAVVVEGSLGDGVLILGQTYRVAEVREHWEPSPDKGDLPTVSTVVRFDPVTPTPDTTEATLRAALNKTWRPAHAALHGPSMAAEDCHRQPCEAARAALQQPAVKPESDREYVRRFARALHRDQQPEGGPR